MKKISVLGLFIFISISLLGQVPADARLKGLDTFVNKVLKDWKAPGVSIAVVEKDKVVYTGGFGYRDIDKKLPVTENTLFGIGSCTKAFTASILGMLEKEGLVDLDKPVRNYLPELRFKNEYTNAHATLRDMMSHRTGLPRHDLSWYASTAGKKELLERIQYMEPTAELREKYQYNNFMFLAQGMVIEKLTGKSWEANMVERIFRPLGMDNSNLSTSQLEKAADRSLAYITIKDRIIPIPYRNIDGIAPAGSVNSNAKDMSRWLITWINNGKFNGKEIIPSTYRNQSISIQTATGGGLPSPEFPDLHLGGYGLGWGMNSYRGHYRVEHGGGIDGFISSTSFFPSDSIGIFVVSNQGGPVSVIRNFIADRMLKLGYRDWNKSQLDAAARASSSATTAQKSDSLNRKLNTKPSHELADYTGNYSNPAYGMIEISLENGKLTSRLSQLKIQMEHFHYDQFNAMPQDAVFEGGPPFRFTFHTDANGNINSITVPLQGGTEDIEFKKEVKAIDVKKSDLAKYTGEYDLSGIIITVSLKGEKNLVMNVPGQPEYELVPVKQHEFKLKNLDGYSVKFELDDKGVITAVYAIQPNGTFKATKKK